MTSRTSLLWSLVALCACGGGGGGESGGSGTASTGAASSGPTTGAGITGGGTEATSTTGTSTTAASTTAASATGTSTATSSSATSGALSTSEPLTTGGSSTSDSGGPPGICVDVSGDYGPCEGILGYGFDGTSCRAFSGCNCEPHCNDFAPEPVICAIGCAAAGECNEAALHPAGINKDPVMPGSFCDELDACAADPESAAWLMQIFDKVECEPANYPCEQGQTCHALWQGSLDADQWFQVCAASLLPGADLQCVIWGP